MDELREKSAKYGFKAFNKESGALLTNGYVVIVALDKKTWKATQFPIEFAEN